MVLQGAQGAEGDSTTAKAGAGKPATKITVSKQTTYVTGPLRPDGYVDYAAAINEHCSRGVTVENNAAIPLWRAMGPGQFDRPETRSEFFKLLGIAELPQDGPYLVDVRTMEGLEGSVGRHRSEPATEKRNRGTIRALRAPAMVEGGIPGPGGVAEGQREAAGTGGRGQPQAEVLRADCRP